jgi:hypothetical protein
MKLFVSYMISSLQLLLAASERVPFCRLGTGEPVTWLAGELQP